MRRISLLVMLLVLATLVAAGCGQYGKQYTGEGGEQRASGEERQITDEKFDAAARKKDGCTEVEEFESEGSTHTSDPDEKVDYQHNPPHSGDHYEVTVEWGRYDKQQPDVQTVHNLEHGHLVISHKGLTDAQEQELEEQVKINDFHIVLQPREANPKKGVYYTAWTAQLYCREPSAAALQYMIDNWRDQGPELFTNDTGGGDMGTGN